MATDPSGDIELGTLHDQSQTLAQWLTLFNLLGVVIDPYTDHSGWVIPTAARIFDHYVEADVRCGFIVLSDAPGARDYLGPYADRYLVLTDNDRALVKSIGLERIPALVHLRQDATIVSLAEGWDPDTWNDVLRSLEDVLAWRSQPQLPLPGDPGPYEGTPALA